MALEGDLMVVVNLDGNGVFGAVWVIGNGCVWFIGWSSLDRLYYRLLFFVRINLYGNLYLSFGIWEPLSI